MPRCYSRLVERWVLGALLVVSMLGFASTASAQFDRGSISGTIKDASGGVVPGVTVTATSAQTQTATVAVTDASGFYTFPALRPGLYGVTVANEPDGEPNHVLPLLILVIGLAVATLWFVALPALDTGTDRSSAISSAVSSRSVTP